MTSRGIIALITRASDEQETALLAQLRAQMPDEDIISLRQMAPADYAKVDIAIVANPDPKHLQLLPNLNWIQSTWAGVERLLAELGDINVPIVRLVDPELARTMAEAVLSWSLYLFRDMPRYQDQQRAKIWHQLPYRKPQEVTIAILGLGLLGQAAAHALQSVGFRVVGWSRTEKNIENVSCYHGAEGLPAALSQSQIVVSLLPLTPQTKGLLDRHTFAHMQTGAELINFGRGAVINDDDLLAALNSGQLRHAVLDVFTQEPIAPENPYWDHPNVTVLPHISGPTDSASAAAIIANNIDTYRKNGTIPESVDRDLGY